MLAITVRKFQERNPLKLRLWISKIWFQKSTNVFVVLNNSDFEMILQERIHLFMRESCHPNVNFVSTVFHIRVPQINMCQQFMEEPSHSNLVYVTKDAWLDPYWRKTIYLQLWWEKEKLWILKIWFQVYKCVCFPKRLNANKNSDRSQWSQE